METIIGIVGGFAAIVISILWDGGDVIGFVNIPSIFITFGGAICAMLVSYPFSSLKSLIPLMIQTTKKHEIDLQKDIEAIINIANIARREGLLALEDAVAGIDSPFLKKGVMLVVDGADPELIKNIMEAEIYFIQDRHSKGTAMLDTLAELGPGFGMIGTLIGLINMLNALDDPSALGPGMAVAMLTTLYGSVLANLIASPMSKKLDLMTAQEVLEKELLMEGLLSIQDGENPRIIKDKLDSFIARSQIKELDGGGAKSETEEIS